MSSCLQNQSVCNNSQDAGRPLEVGVSNRVVVSKSEVWPLEEAMAGLSVSAPCKSHASSIHLMRTLPSEASPPSSPFWAPSGPTAPQRLRGHLAAASDNRLGSRALAVSNNFVNSISIDVTSVAASTGTLDHPEPRSNTKAATANTSPTSPPNQLVVPPPPSSAATECRNTNNPNPSFCSPAAPVLPATAFGSAVTSAQAPTPAVGVSPPEHQNGEQQQAQQPCPSHWPAPPRPQSVLLAVSAGTPPGMHRPAWSVGDYVVDRRIFKGAMSAVYKAACRQTGLPVALKVYLLSRIPSNALHMLSREITIHSNMNHKNIVTLYGAFQEEGRLVLVQEFASRGDLHRLHRGLARRLSEEQVQGFVLAPFLDALAYMHAKGVCHRDIKPENIMFSQDWRLKIGDFGVSIDLNQERAVTRAGTLDYMAPEVERCPIKHLPQDNKNDISLAYTTAADIWATGVLVYELLVGFPPCVVDRAQADSLAAARTASLHTTGSTTPSFPASTSPGARDFITAALQSRPEDRPTALDLVRHPWVRRAVLAARMA